MRIDTRILPLKYRRTKIVATLGPSSSDEATLSRLIEAGVDVFRLNFSHGTHGSHGATYARVRSVAESRRQPTAILADLSGPKIRVGDFPGGSILLEKDQRVTVTTREVPGDRALIPSRYEALARDVKEGDRILLDDGALALRVLRVEGTEVFCEVEVGGELKSRKGMNLPGVALSTPSLTEKDRDDARFALDLGVDFLALSFVRRAADVEELKSLVALVAQVGKTGARPSIIAKIERPEALEDIDAILDAADGIMVARGDLGVEMPPQKVPLIQIQLTDRARAKAKPVIVATQMLESMVEKPRPTRAEVSDVALAVRSGADAVMLSAESATGKYPVLAVEMMDTIARETEAYLWHAGGFRVLSEPLEAPVDSAAPMPAEDALARAMAQLSRDIQARAIVVISKSGRTAQVMSASRPAAPIVATSPDSGTCRKTALLWGIIPRLVEEKEFDRPENLARRLARDLGLGVEGQTVLLVRGFGGDPSLAVVTL
jgi:pyruvate kinase